PLLRETLTEKGLPSTVVEVDVGEPLSGRVTGRISAFLEMLRQ
ncbi:MAG: 2-hydroxyacyl-CoA dehydratase, partial [Deltaproteobacteria bacterium]